MKVSSHVVEVQDEKTKLFAEHAVIRLTAEDGSATELDFTLARANEAQHLVHAFHGCKSVVVTQVSAPPTEAAPEPAEDPIPENPPATIQPSGPK